MELKNWKSIESATLYIDPLTILIGLNAYGKSNILDAFMFLKRIASGLSISGKDDLFYQPLHIAYSEW